MNPARKTLASPPSSLLLACGLATFASAQNPPTESAAPAASDDSVVVLSPFEVNEARDVGYLAQNTLAGSRLNAQLKDTAAAISVLTPEFLKDIGATNMKDIILFQNNAVPDFGDADSNFNGNPMIGNSEWQLRIRGLDATYGRNYFPWRVSTDFYNVDRIDQSRGPNAILFGFGAAGGIVNTTTKQALLSGQSNEVSFAVGSWDRYRGTVDTNQVLVPGKLALRLNAMAENGHTWREFEFDRARRADLAAKWKINDTSSVRAEVEVGKVTDNVARPWLMIDQSFAWRDSGRPTYTSQWADSWGTPIDSFWPSHHVVGDDGVVRDWLGFPFASNANSSAPTSNYQAATWSHLALTEENLAIIPTESNPAGPDAIRETKYHALTAIYENQVTDQLAVELAINHQYSKFLGYDANGSRATTYYGDSSELWGDASAYLPDWTVNPNAGDLYLENNWTRRKQTDKATFIRGTGAYTFTTGDWGKHRFAAMYEFSKSKAYRIEECEILLARASGTNATDDVNRLYRRHYFTEGDASDIHVGSWRDTVEGSGWSPTQDISDTTDNQHTGMLALQSEFFSKRLVTTLGVRFDSLQHLWTPVEAPSAATDYSYELASGHLSKSFNPRTFTLGAVYHLNDMFSVYGNHSNNRQLPNFNIHLVDSYIAPMTEGQGSDFGLKVDLFGGKVYATVGYYTTEQRNTTDYGNVAGMVSLNNRILGALYTAGEITAAEQTAHSLDSSINGYLADRTADGWEFSVVANPLTNWRITANLSINDIKYKNIMSDVKDWADSATAFWLDRGGPGFLLGGGDWDTIINQIGWGLGEVYTTGGSSDRSTWTAGTVVGLEGLQARGQRKYGANLYTKYTFTSGVLKNISIGGGGRYQSANVLGYYYGASREGRNLLLADASLGYTFKTEFLGKGSWAELQLNVGNLFNTRKYQVYSLAWWDTSTSIPERIGLQEPRKFTFTATLHF
jgi:outer membrane receptor protein involved in Fe transport